MKHQKNRLECYTKDENGRLHSGQCCHCRNTMLTCIHKRTLWNKSAFSIWLTVSDDRRSKDHTLRTVGLHQFHILLLSSSLLLLLVVVVVLCSSVHRRRVVMFAAIRLRGPGFKPQPGQKFETTFLLHSHPSSGEGVSPVQGEAIRRRYIKPEYLSYPIVRATK